MRLQWNWRTLVCSPNKNYRWQLQERLPSAQVLLHQDLSYRRRVQLWGPHPQTPQRLPHIYLQWALQIIMYRRQQCKSQWRSPNKWDKRIIHHLSQEDSASPNPVQLWGLKVGSAVPSLSHFSPTLITSLVTSLLIQVRIKSDFVLFTKSVYRCHLNPFNHTMFRHRPIYRLALRMSLLVPTIHQPITHNSSIIIAETMNMKPSHHVFTVQMLWWALRSVIHQRQADLVSFDITEATIAL